MCVTHPKRVKLETQNLCLGNIIRPGADKKKSSQGDSQYWCTACNRNLRLLFLGPVLVYWCTACDRDLQLLFCCLEHNGRTDRKSVVTAKSSSVAEGLQDFHQDTRRDPKYPPWRSVRPLFFLSSCTFFWPCMVLHKTTQHDIFSNSAKG